MAEVSFTQSLDRLKESFLWAAAQGGNTQDCESLIEIGADVNWRNNEGDTPLLAACRRGHMETATVLIVHGADVNVVGDDSYSPLHICCRRGNYELLTLLLEANASTSLMTSDGETAMDIAKTKGYEDIYNRLLQYSTVGNVNSSLIAPSRPLGLESSASAPALSHLVNSLEGLSIQGSGPLRRQARQHPVLPALPATSGARGAPPSATSSLDSTPTGPPVQPKIAPLRDVLRQRSDSSGTTTVAVTSDAKIELPSVLPSYTLMGQHPTSSASGSTLSEEQNVSLRKLFDIEHRERRAAEAKLELTRQQMNRLISELAEFKTQIECMETDRDELANRVKLLSGKGLDPLSLRQVEELERDLRGAVSAVEARKNVLISEELNSRNDLRTCVICKEKDKSVLLLPCRHLCLCDTCAEHDKLVQCPLCRRAIVHKISVYA